MSIYLPFTYLIGWSKLNLYYYGSMSRKTKPIANPDLLWTKYFTSSKYVEKIREEYGEPDIIQVRKVFKTCETCRRWELKVLRRLKVLHSDKWLNKNIGGFYVLDEDIKRKLSESRTGIKNHMYGNTHTKEAREKISRYKKDKNLSETHKDSISKGLYDYYSKEESKGLKERFREYISGDKAIRFSGYFITPWGKYSVIEDAINSCPVLISRNAIRKWCKDSDKKICYNSYKSSHYLRNLNIDKEILLTKTFRDLGFDFEKATPKPRKTPTNTRKTK